MASLILVFTDRVMTNLFPGPTNRGRLSIILRVEDFVDGVKQVLRGIRLGDDRNAAAHTSQTDPGTGDAFANSNNVGAGASFATAGSKSANPNMPSFAGFTAGTLSNTGGYACRTDVPAQNALADLGGGFNVLTLVVEVPKTLLTTGFASPVVHVWATTNSSTGS